MDRPRLWNKGKKIQYPMVLLRLSLRAYAWKRRITSERNISSGWLHAVRGIAPGSAFVAQELKLYLIDLVLQILCRPRAQAMVHADDMIGRLEACT